MAGNPSPATKNERPEKGLFPLGDSMFYIYVILSSKGKIYTGHTSDLSKRLSEHNSGLCKSTKIDKGWKLVHSETFESSGAAMKREKWLKTGTGREFVKEIIRGVESASAE